MKVLIRKAQRPPVDVLIQYSQKLPTVKQVAKDRVKTDPDLAPYQGVLLNDFGIDADDLTGKYQFWNWVATAPKPELLNMARGVDATDSTERLKGNHRFVRPDDKEIDAIKSDVGESANAYNAFYVRDGINGGYDSVWGVAGETPTFIDNYQAYKLKSGNSDSVKRSWIKRRMNVQHSDFHRGTDKTSDMPAHQYGDYVVHPQLNQHGTRNGKWAITHLPSNRVVAAQSGPNAFEEAKKYVETEQAADDRVATVKPSNRRQSFRGASGLRGTSEPLQKTYGSLDEFKDYSETYGLHKRLGFASAEEAWNANPRVGHTTEPSDYTIVKSGTSEGVRKGDETRKRRGKWNQGRGDWSKGTVHIAHDYSADLKSWSKSAVPDAHLLGDWAVHPTQKRIGNDFVPVRGMWSITHAPSGQTVGKTDMGIIEAKKLATDLHKSGIKIDEHGKGDLDSALGIVNKWIGHPDNKYRGILKTKDDMPPTTSRTNKYKSLADFELIEKREFSEDRREELAEEGDALPDGSFPIVNSKDLANAVKAFGRAKNPEKAKSHIKDRARALGLTDQLPEEWRAEKSDSLPDGSFTILNADDIDMALKLINRATNPAAVKAHVIRRSIALDLIDKLPDGWVHRSRTVGARDKQPRKRHGTTQKFEPLGGDNSYHNKELAYHHQHLNDVQSSSLADRKEGAAEALNSMKNPEAASRHLNDVFMENYGHGPAVAAHNVLMQTAGANKHASLIQIAMLHAHSATPRDVAANWHKLSGSEQQALNDAVDNTVESYHQHLYGSVNKSLVEMSGNSESVRRSWVKRHQMGTTASGKTVPHYNDDTYTKREKRPKWNGLLDVTTDTLEGARMLRQRLPDWSKQDHIDAAHAHAEAARTASSEWGAVQDEAHQATFGTKATPFDYKVSGIGRDEYSEEHKNMLRELAHASSSHRSISVAHWKAAGHRNAPKTKSEAMLDLVAKARTLGAKDKQPRKHRESHATPNDNPINPATGEHKELTAREVMDRRIFSVTNNTFFMPVHFEYMHKKDLPKSTLHTMYRTNVDKNANHFVVGKVMDRAEEEPIEYHVLESHDSESHARKRAMAYSDRHEDMMYGEGVSKEEYIDRVQNEDAGLDEDGKQFRAVITDGSEFKNPDGSYNRELLWGKRGIDD